MADARLFPRFLSFFASLVALVPTIVLAGLPPADGIVRVETETQTAGSANRGNAGTSRVPNVPTRTAGAALEDCRALMARQLHEEAIARCGEAVRLDPALSEPYFLTGLAHDFLWQKGDAATATPGAPRASREDHRQKAAESYRKFLALSQPDAEPVRRDRHAALSALLGLYIFGGAHEGDLEYANELARDPSLTRSDLLSLAGAYARHERPNLSEKFLKAALKANPSDAQVCEILARLYNEPLWNGRSRFDDSMATLEQCATMSPRDPVGYYKLAAFLWEKARRDETLTDPQRQAYVDRGLGHADRALGLGGDFWQAMVYKSLLLGLKARTVSDPAIRQGLVDEADALRKRAMALRAAGVPSPHGLADAWQPSSPPSSPAQSGTVGGVAEGVVGGVLSDTPMRVGGDVKAPVMRVHVDPVYPEVARKARVSGEVVVECTIDKRGNVTNVKVLQPRPFLTDAAVEAVRQWKFEPATLHGEPVDVLLTSTVKFSLDEPKNTSQP